MILADKIIDLRKKAGWSQEELAEKLAVTRQSVSKWEGAQSIPDMDKVVQMSRLFGVTTDYLLKDELEEQTAAPVEEDDEDEEAERVQRYAPKGRLFDDDDDESGTQMYDTDKVDGYDDEDDIHDAPAAKRGRYADEDEISEDDEMAERIIRWAPPITTVVCALIIAVSLIYRFVLA